jgi:hypothetical protein
MRFLSAFDTQWLARASFEPMAGRRGGKRLWLLALIAAAALGAGAANGYLDWQLTLPGRAATSAEQRAKLVAELQRLRTELEMERATRKELQRYADELSRKVTELTHQLEFLNSRGVSAGTAEAPQIANRE